MARRDCGGSSLDDLLKDALCRRFPCTSMTPVSSGARFSSLPLNRPLSSSRSPRSRGTIRCLSHGGMAVPAVYPPPSLPRFLQSAQRCTRPVFAFAALSRRCFFRPPAIGPRSSAAGEPLVREGTLLMRVRVVHRAIVLWQTGPCASVRMTVGGGHAASRDVPCIALNAGGCNSGQRERSSTRCFLQPRGTTWVYLYSSSSAGSGVGTKWSVMGTGRTRNRLFHEAHLRLYLSYLGTTSPCLSCIRVDRCSHRKLQVTT